MPAPGWRSSRVAKVVIIVAGVVVGLAIIGLVTKGDQPNQSAATDLSTSVSVSAQSAAETMSASPALAATTTAESGPPAVYPVLSVVDGDTLHVLVNGQDEKVRLIGINAPETNECWGSNATTAASALLNGASVQLLADPTQADKDEYGRLLRYVMLPDGTDFGLKMINDGNAYEYTYDAPYQNQAQYQNLQAAAKANGNGLWSAGTCNGQRTTVPATTPPAAAPAAAQPTSPTTADTTSASCDIKGNINSKGDKIYHVPGSRDYDKTEIDESKGERWFCSVAEAEAAGWRAPLN